MGKGKGLTFIVVFSFSNFLQLKELYIIDLNEGDFNPQYSFFY